VLDKVAIRSSEDAFVDQLYAKVPEFGAPLLAANMPRAYVDLNRAVDELDPALIYDVKPTRNNPRISSGLGVIARVVSKGRAIYTGKIALQEAQSRLETCWYPYHDQLQNLLNESHKAFGEAILIDCHSMPHEAVKHLRHDDTDSRPEIILGDRFGAAASREIVDQIEDAFCSAGFICARNSPFAGAYISQRYGRPMQSQHVIQIEIDRSLYMHEGTVRPNENFDQIRCRLSLVIKRIAQIGSVQTALAAE
jgi:N-formylglutamate deformylase